MSARTGAIIGCALLLALAACGRRPPSPSPENQADSPAAAGSDAAAPPIELAGGPASDAPPEATAEASDQPAEPAPDDARTPGPPLQASRTAGLDGAARPWTGGDVSDPFEPVNRGLYAVDRAVGQAVAKRPRVLRQAPARAQPVLMAVRNALNNLDEPSVAANDLLQGKLGRALKSAARFVINSTLGVAGISDAAARMGIKRRDNDLDRTLARYGVPAGPYLYLPVAGPTTLRAALGAAAEGYLYPPHWLHLAAGIGAALRGAGYAKLARTALTRADARPPAGPDRDNYLKTRGAFFEARADPGARPGAAPLSQPQMLAETSRPPRPTSDPRDAHLVRNSSVTASMALDARE